MAMRYNVTAISGPIGLPSTATLVLIGDASSTTLNVPIGIIPFSLARIPNAVDVTGTAGSVNAGGSLSADGLVVQIVTSGAVLGNGVTLNATFTFRYSGV